MTDPNERRRIVWGPIEHANLDPFVVARSGQVFNADTGKRKKALTQHEAAKSWNRNGRGLWYEADSTAKKGRGPRLPHLKATDLIRTGLDEVARTKWLHKLKPGYRPATVCPRPGEVPLDGDPSDGWYELEGPGRWVSAFHGPSIAAWLFGETHVADPFEVLRAFRIDDNSST